MSGRNGRDDAAEALIASGWVLDRTNYRKSLEDTMRVDIGSHARRAVCVPCGGFRAVRNDGTFRVHRNGSDECPGSRRSPEQASRNSVTVDEYQSTVQ